MERLSNIIKLHKRTARLSVILGLRERSEKVNTRPIVISECSW